MKEYLIYATDQIAQKYDIQLTPKSYDLRFLELLRKMSALNQVVILIDEYDKPKYYEKQLKKDKELVLIGVEFDQTEKNIGVWVVDNVS